MLSSDERTQITMIGDRAAEHQLPREDEGQLAVARRPPRKARQPDAQPVADRRRRASPEAGSSAAACRSGAPIALRAPNCAQVLQGEAVERLARRWPCRPRSPAPRRCAKLIGMPVLSKKYHHVLSMNPCLRVRGQPRRRAGSAGTLRGRSAPACAFTSTNDSSLRSRGANSVARL